MINTLSGNERAFASHRIPLDRAIRAHIHFPVAIPIEDVGKAIGVHVNGHRYRASATRAPVEVIVRIAILDGLQMVSRVNIDIVDICNLHGQ